MAGWLLMMPAHFYVDDRIISRAGWLGTVERVIRHRTNTTYRVRWDRNGRTSIERNSIDLAPTAEAADGQREPTPSPQPTRS